MATLATVKWYLRIPPPLWTLAFLLIAYGLEWSGAIPPIMLMHSLPAAILLAVAGLALAVSAVRKFFVEGTEIEPASAANKKLVTNGPFRFTRNPMYLGLILVSLGIAFYMGTLAFFAVPVLVFLLCNFLFIPFEEEKMQRQHGNPYTEYMHRVRRWI
ncbi:MAG TPA: isoprenylcysteine carboxylmethyltransferase family protein [Micropepsaceae bacterium]|nr:isoprenylcysteine carboxylmethyltransferase family protein [Micropepsaceae bacterium]